MRALGAGMKLWAHPVGKESRESLCWGSGGDSVDLLLLPGGGGDGAVGVDDELGAANHHSQQEEAREHHEGDGEALIHVDGHAGGTQACSPSRILQGRGGWKSRSSNHRTKHPTVPSGIPSSFPSLHSLPAFQENPG